MAETFKSQVDALTGFAGTEDDALTDWLTAGAREVFAILPPKMKEKCISLTELNASTNSLEDLDGYGEVISVTRKHADSSGIYYTCRKIPTWAHGRATDSSDTMYYGTVTDPVYYIYSNSLRVAPTPGNTQKAQIHHYVMPTVAHGATLIVDFPDEAEYLVTLYASVRALQRLQNNMNTVSAIDTAAFALIKAAVDQAETAANKFESATESIFGDEDTFDTAASQLTRVKDALNNAEKIIDDGANSPTGNAAGDAATYLYTEEDTELVQGALAIAGSEINRAQAHIAEWVSIGDMRVKEVNVALAEANGYVSEAKIRMERESQKYQWYQAQQVKLQQDYDKGIQMLVAQGIPQPTQQQGRK